MKEKNKRLSQNFYLRDVLVVAPELLGKMLCCKDPKGNVHCHIITETEAYKGERDKACHAAKGRSSRNDIMYHRGGHVYIYLIYGMYWMLNVVTGEENNPQAVLIRGLQGLPGPGILTKKIGIDKSYHGEKLWLSERIWIEDTQNKVSYVRLPRVGIDYAGEYWKKIPWRYLLKEIR